MLLDSPSGKSYDIAQSFRQLDPFYVCNPIHQLHWLAISVPGKIGGAVAVFRRSFRMQKNLLERKSLYYARCRFRQKTSSKVGQRLAEKYALSYYRRSRALRKIAAAESEFTHTNC